MAKKEKPSKPTILLDNNFFNKIKKYSEIENKIKEYKSISDSLNKEIKETSKNEWINLYKNMLDNPGTVLIESYLDNEVAQVSLIPQDRYRSINEKEVDDMIEKWGNDIIDEKTTFKLDEKMVEKWGSVISKLILESDEIDEKDKRRIIKIETSYSIKKGLIDNLYDYDNMEELFENISPVFSLKEPNVLKLNNDKEVEEIINTETNDDDEFFKMFE